MEFLALGLRRRQGYQVYGRCGRVQKDCDARVASQVEALIPGFRTRLLVAVCVNVDVYPSDDP